MYNNCYYYTGDKCQPYTSLLPTSLNADNYLLIDAFVLIFVHVQGYKIATGQVSKEELRNVSDRYGKYRRQRQFLPCAAEQGCFMIPSYK